MMRDRGAAMAPKIRYTMAGKLLRVSVSLIFVLFVVSLGEGSTDPDGETKTAVQLHAEGNKFFDQGQYQDAVAVWLKEISLDPENANTANNIGIAYRRLGQHDTAIEYHKKAIELNPRFGHGYYSLGLAHYDREEYEEAKNAFLGAVQMNYSRGTSYYNLGLVYHALRDYPNAETSYLKAIQFGNISGSAHYALGLTYFEWGNHSKALAAFKEAKKINPELPEIDSQIKRCNQLLDKPLLDRIAFWKGWKMNPEGARTSSMENEKIRMEGWYFPVLSIVFILGIGVFVLFLFKIAKNLKHRS